MNPAALHLLVTFKTKLLNLSLTLSLSPWQGRLSVSQPENRDSVAVNLVESASLFVFQEVKLTKHRPSRRATLQVYRKFINRFHNFPPFNQPEYWMSTLYLIVFLYEAHTVNMLYNLMGKK